MKTILYSQSNEWPGEPVWNSFAGRIEPSRPWYSIGAGPNNGVKWTWYGKVGDEHGEVTRL